MKKLSRNSTRIRLQIVLRVVHNVLENLQMRKEQVSTFCNVLENLQMRKEQVSQYFTSNQK